MKEHPLIKTVLLIISGILIQHFLNLNLQILISALMPVFALCIIILIFKGGKAVRTAAASAGLILTGAILLSLADRRLKPYPFSCTIMRDVTVTGSVEEIELKNGNEFCMTLKTDTLRISQTAYSSGLRVLLKVKEANRERLDSVYSNISPGCYISISGTLFKAREDRNPGEFNYYNYLQRKGISAVFTGSNVKILKNDNSISAAFSGAVFGLRKSADRKITELTSPAAAALLRGLLLADRGGITDDIESDFINTGVVHILAVSGSNVLLVILLLSIVFGRIEIRLKTLLFLAGIFGFLIFTGTGSSVTRAVLMTSAALTALLGNRSINAINAAALSALIILFLNPFELFDPGFQLSYSAVLSIILINPIISGITDKFRGKRSGLIRALIYYPGVTLAAQAGTLPLTIYYFGTLSLIAPFANLIIIPVIGALSATAAGAVILGGVWQYAGEMYGKSGSFLADLAIFLTHWMAGLKYSHINSIGFGIPTVLVFYAGMLIFFVFWGKMKSILNKILFILLLTAAVSVLIGAARKETVPTGRLSVLAIDVGQGDATLVKTPGGKTILIDCGKADLDFDSGSRIIYPLLLRMDIRQIDYAFITHVDGDHYSGILFLLQKGIIGQVFKPRTDSTDTKDINLCKYATYMNVPIKDFKEQALTIDNVRIYMLYPEVLNSARRLSKNDRSGVLKIVYGESSFLFTGDAGFREEKYLVNKYGSFLKSTVLKMGHHGSRSSTSDEFLKTVSPCAGLISSGILNRYGHPSPEVLQKLKERQISILRTDIGCGVLLVSDGMQTSRIDWKQGLTFSLNEL